jgi:hypothetical protein
MAFDAAPAAEVTARDRLIRLRDFLAELPEDRFAMWAVGEVDYQTHECLTPACMCGWAQALFYDGYVTPGQVAADLGLTPFQGAILFRLICSPGLESMSVLDPRFDKDSWAIRASRDEAVQVLDHLLSTGCVDWGVARK